MTDENDPLLKLREALETIRKRFDAGADDWQYGVLSTFRHYLQARGFERRLIDPIEAMVLANADATLLARRRADGVTGTPKPSGAKFALAYAAAAVTTLKNRHGKNLPDALTAVAKASGFDKGAIRKFRDNLSRGGNRVPAGSKENFDTVMSEMRDLEYSADEILAAVTGIGNLWARPV
ncbi:MULTISPECIES: hypothetical protein [Rhizobium]|uniref:hypothetical protein n=1 Tax=Rhizobium TaxID=379 RepID=UPI00102FEC8E|nr:MULTISPECIES: hypothetical protein [Rhizobium]MBY5483257.1 hypothetical protein [Rhizobium leguminosarum]NEI28478.1 hypothetical protein [Rhizobium ruizarguesonis]NKL65001.1 hypothetical protein [Rhizobium leguminosarum bv. viciae]TBA81195.1 hypothetical protein ELH56_13575 [Rhizobium ruizarguesonis]TBZ64507.1 hypothetical protein E0H43_32815 [Rhizobium leguminosarum bv. viciae]